VLDQNNILSCTNQYLESGLARMARTAYGTLIIPCTAEDRTPESERDREASVMAVVHAV